MAIDLSGLSDDQLIQMGTALQSIHQMESNNAPDTSTITNPKSGAFSSMQVTGPTQTRPGFGVTPSNGTPQDTAREGRDYYTSLMLKYKNPMDAAMAYNWGPGNMDKWIANGRDMSKVPDETLKYAYNHMQTLKNTQASQPTSPTVGAPMGFGGGNNPSATDLSTMSDDQLKAAYNQQHPGARIQDFLNQVKQQTNTMVNAAQGVGELGATQATGMLDVGAGALAGGAQLLQGHGLDAAKKAFNDQQNVLTYQAKTPEGKAYVQKAGEAFENYIQNPLEKGAVASLQAIPFIGTELAQNPTAQNYAKLVADVVANVAPFALGGEGLKTQAEGKGIRAPEAASELDKLNKLNEAPAQPTPEEAPVSMGPFQEGMGPLEGQPNAGPQRGAFITDTSGVTRPSTLTPSEQPFLESAQEHIERVKAQSNDLAMAEPNTGPQFPGGMEPNAGPQIPSDVMAQRTTDFIKAVQQGHEFTQGDMFNELNQRRFDQFTGENPRALSHDEFYDAMTALSEQEGTRFNPEEIVPAYSKYLDMVSDKQGGLFDRATIAKNFADAAGREAMDRYVEDHPIVKANAAKLEVAQAKLDSALDSQTRMGAQGDVTRLQALLDKSRENISKFYQGDGRFGAYEKDGIIHMNSGIPIPDWMKKGLISLLQHLHGVVFKFVDRMLPNQRNLNSTGNIFAQAIKDRVNREANRQWDTKENQQPRQVLKGVDGLRTGLKDYLPLEAQDLSPEQLKSNMQQAQDLRAGTVANALRTQFLTGQQLAAFSKHPLVKFAVESVDRAMRDSARFVRETLMGKDGLRSKARALSDDEFAGIWNLLQQNEGKRIFSESELRKAGYTDKQIDLYQHIREVDAQKLADLNRGRAAAGYAPVDARIAHIAGHFLGDFKRLITDKDGKVVAVIAHNLRTGVETISKRVLEQLGEGYEMGKIELNRKGEGHANERYLGYMNILNDFAGRDDVIAKVAEAYRDYQTSDAQAAMRYRAAFKQKEGVIGAEGRKSWQDAITNAREGMKNELRSAEAMNQWANMQEVISKVADFTKDPEINAPVAKQVVDRYMKDVQRRNQGPIAECVNNLTNGFANITGVGPSVLRGFSSGMKTGLLTMFIGLGKLSHSFVTLIQPLQGIPVVSSLMRAEAKASGGVPVAHPLGIRSAISTIKAFGSQASFLKALATGKDPGGFEGRALKFARDNDTFNSSQFQFGHLTDIDRSNFGRAAHNIAEFNVTGMESATRAFTYMYYSHMLRDMGLPESQIFPTAHNAMRGVMVDYNAWERPGIFGKLGLLGDLTAMLTRYKFLELNQFAQGTKYALKGQLGPMMAIMGTSIAAAGVRGIMLYSIANALVGQVTTWAAKNGLMQKPTDLDEILLHALHGVNEHLANALKFGLPSGLGLNMTGSLSHADDIPNDPLGALLPQAGPLGNYAKALYEYAHDPNKATAKTALYNIAPNAAKGLIENTMFTNQQTGRFTNPNTYETKTIRSPADQIKRLGGFRPLHEANEALTGEVDRTQGEREASVRDDITAKILRDIDSNNNRVTPELRDKIINQYVGKYLANTGDPDKLGTDMLEHMGYGQALTAAQRQQGIPSNLQTVLNYLRYQKLK